MNEEESMSLLDLLALLRKHLVLVTVLPIVAGIGVFVGSLFLPNEYTASTTMYVLSREDQTEQNAVTLQDMNLGQMITTDVVTLIKSDRVKKDVAEKVGLANLNAYDFNVTNTTNTRVITLDVTGKDPEQAANVANATVEVVSGVATDVMHLQSVNPIDAATPPKAPSGPRRVLYGAVGLMAGLFVAVAIVMVRDMLDTRVRSGEEAEKIVGVPVVGHFPATNA